MSENYRMYEKKMAERGYLEGGEMANTGGDVRSCAPVRSHVGARRSHQWRPLRRRAHPRPTNGIRVRTSIQLAVAGTGAGPRR